MSGETLGTEHIGENPNVSEQGQARIKRNRMFKAGIASYHNNTLTVDCIIRDQAPKGAKLRLEKGALVPDHFMLTIPIDGIKVDCEVKWRDGLDFGVKFVSEIQVDKRNVRKQSVDVEYLVPRKSILRKTRS